MDIGALKAGFDAQEFFGPTLAKLALFIVLSFLLIAFFAYDLYCPIKTPPQQFARECVFYFSGYWRMMALIVGSYLAGALIVFAYNRLVKKK